jgi:hypothetical protein
VVVPEQVADLVLQHGQQVHRVPLALVPAPEELGVGPGGAVHEPPPPGRVVVQPDRVTGGEAKRRAAEVGDADVDAGQGGRVGTGGLPSTKRLGQW